MDASVAPELTMRRAVPADRAELVRLFAELRVAVAGSQSAALQRALIALAFRDPRVVLLVAEQAGQLAGLGLAVIDPRQFWKALALRHPQLLGERLLALARRRLRRRSAATDVAVEDCRQYLSPSSGRAWGESSPAIAHVLLVTLRPELRGAGAGPRLFGALLDELARRGVRRFDSRISKTNLASVRMCHRMGIPVEDAPGTFFVTADLPWRRT